MAKRGSTGFHARPKLTSSAGLFEKRGDKWGGGSRPLPLPHNPTAVELAIDAVLEKMGNAHGYAAEVSQRLRQANTDDPELDQFTRARKAEIKQRYVDPVGEKTEATPQRRVTNVLARMHKNMQKRVIKVK